MRVFDQWVHEVTGSLHGVGLYGVASLADGPTVIAALAYTRHQFP